MLHPSCQTAIVPDLAVVRCLHRSYHVKYAVEMHARLLQCPFWNFQHSGGSQCSLVLSPFGELLECVTLQKPCQQLLYVRRAAGWASKAFRKSLAPTQSVCANSQSA